VPFAELTTNIEVSAVSLKATSDEPSSQTFAPFDYDALDP
jgi:hypothetical protein